jgi:hypothetical protein
VVVYDEDAKTLRNLVRHGQIAATTRPPR